MKSLNEIGASLPAGQTVNPKDEDAAPRIAEFKGSATSENDSGYDTVGELKNTVELSENKKDMSAPPSSNTGEVADKAQTILTNGVDTQSKEYVSYLEKRLEVVEMELRMQRKTYIILVPTSIPLKLLSNL